MKRTTDGLRAVMPLLLFSAAGCGELVAPAIGGLEVAVSTAGATADLDVDGYVLRIDDDAGKPFSSRTIRLDLSVGEHRVRLDGLAPNCSVNGTAERAVTIARGGSVSVSFDVDCVRNTGTISVSTVISGPAPQGHMFRVHIQEVGSYDFASTSVQVVPLVRVGRFRSSVVNPPRNCVVEGINERDFVVRFGETTNLVFQVTCQVAGGLSVKSQTIGTPMNKDEIVVDLRMGAESIAEFAVPANGTGSLRPLLPGTYSVFVKWLPLNCAPVVANPRVVAVAAGDDTALDVTIECASPRRIAYVMEAPDNESIYSVNSDGTDAVRLTTSAGGNRDPAWSPDGTRIAFTSSRDGNQEIYSMNADGSNQVRLTQTAGSSYRPAWSPDGTELAFTSESGQRTQVYAMNADGTNVRRLTDQAGSASAPDWSIDGKIAYQVGNTGDARTGIWTMNADGSGAIQLTSNVLGDLQPSWSPNGKTIAFARSRRANPQSYTDIFVVNSDGSVLTAITHGVYDSNPAWSSDGSWIAYERRFGGCTGFYAYYDCGPWVAFVKADLSGETSFSIDDGSNPAWQR